MVGQLVKYGAINQTNLLNPRLEQSRYRNFHSAPSLLQKIFFKSKNSSCEFCLLPNFTINIVAQFWASGESF